ncbi:LamG domain-containing protein [Aerosakkonema sp. BLCC-F183]|uniref:LamG domain-containing protein n=1 Tax=Aerosakkonema sp. BLCC-F183 TaxID=3342834 RepID=UPI0035B6B79F
MKLLTRVCLALLLAVSITFGSFHRKANALPGANFLAQIPVYTASDKVSTFNGINECDKVENSDAINFASNQDFTVAVWIKPDSEQKDIKNGDNDVVEKWLSGGYPYVIRYLNTKTGNSAGKIVAARYDGKNNPGVYSNTKINDGKFHHVTFVRSTENNQGKLSLYIDGKLEATNPDTTTGNTKNNYPLYLGCRGYSQNSGVNYFAGSITGLAIYNVALTPEQIQAVVTPNYPPGIVPINIASQTGELTVLANESKNLPGLLNTLNQPVTVKISAEGMWQAAASGEPNGLSVDANGIPGVLYKEWLFPELNLGTLVAQVKDAKGVSKFIKSGKEQTFELQPGETAYFIFNDGIPYFTDNTGSQKVKFSIK